MPVPIGTPYRHSELNRARRAVQIAIRSRIGLAEWGDSGTRSPAVPVGPGGDPGVVLDAGDVLVAEPAAAIAIELGDQHTVGVDEVEPVRVLLVDGLPQ